MPLRTDEHVCGKSDPQNTDLGRLGSPGPDADSADGGSRRGAHICNECTAKPAGRLGSIQVLVFPFNDPGIPCCGRVAPPR